MGVFYKLFYCQYLLLPTIDPYISLISYSARKDILILPVNALMLCS